ncbi:MAG TPA: hypothetical protein VGQ65_07220 [Thermoanaerobaculia bacterium]|nr:hypothetical protein [Thermoanaerobaculia bacterium]
MHKNSQHVHGGLRGFAAAAAIASLAAFGCSTNRTPGDGQPGMTAPATPASTPGTSSGTSNPPMASAANESPATVAAQPRERFLGTINPSGPQPVATTPQAPTGQLIPPSAYANPQITVNASISSAPTPVVTGGSPTDEAAFLAEVGGGATTGTTAAATVGATSAAPTISTTSVAATPTTAAITTTPTMTNTTLTPTTAAIAATPGQFAAGPTTTSAATGASTTILTPTLTSSANPSPTRAANPPLASLRVTPVATPATASSTSATASTPTTSTPTTRTAATARVVAPIRVITNANGTVTVTNASTPPPSVIKNQK